MTLTNILGTTPANDRMGYAQTNVRPGLILQIEVLLAYKVKICAAERYNQINMRLNPMVDYCWPAVCESGSTSNQHGALSVTHVFC